VLLGSIDIRALRNIEHIRFEANPGMNWFVGRNGAGKTAVLEAIFLLARGRSFRGHRQGALVKRGERRLRIETQVLGEGTTYSARVQFSRGPTGRARFFENDVEVEGISDLRGRIHVRIVADNSQRLLEGEPRLRRLFLDWNLFHVEPGYGQLLREFRRVHAQRAAWLRAGGGARAVWDTAYANLAERIALRRLDAVRRLEVHCKELLPGLPQFPGFHLRFSRGWPEEMPLAELLAASVSSDLERGFTFYGPGRADFLVELAEVEVPPSRGQAKLIVCLLQIAAERMWLAGGGPRSIWLLDDLAAELDADGAQAVASLFLGDCRQVFATSVRGDSVGEAAFGDHAAALFHVERGALSRLQ
jgi:DNA replication and repair protein RecF